MPDRGRPPAQPLDGSAQPPGQQRTDHPGDRDDADASEAEEQHAAPHPIVALGARLAHPDGADDLALAVQRGGGDELVTDVGLVGQAAER